MPTPNRPVDIGNSTVPGADWFNAVKNSVYDLVDNVNGGGFVINLHSLVDDGLSLQGTRPGITFTYESNTAKARLQVGTASLQVYYNAVRNATEVNRYDTASGASGILLEANGGLVVAASAGTNPITWITALSWDLLGKVTFSAPDVAITNAVGNGLSLQGTRPVIKFDAGATAIQRLTAVSGNLVFSNNAYHTGSTWERDNTSVGGSLLSLRTDGGALYTFAAGVTPFSLSPVFSWTVTGQVILGFVPVFASDAAAGSGGLTAGALYKHSDGSLYVKA